MRVAGILMVCLGLVACGGEEQQELRDWMRDASKDLKGGIPPLPEIKPNTVVAYEAEALIDPFKAAKVDPQKKVGSGGGAGGLRPDFDRRKEPLEAFPLESLKMVGTLTKGKMTHAIVQADKALHQVKIGNYMGQNFGIVTDVNESEVVLKELVEDGTGEWAEKVSTLQLQEKK